MASFRFLCAVTLFLLLTPALEAAWLKKVPVTVRQPDGTVLKCYASGDEYYNWLHDSANYTIIQNPSNGYYVYAQVVDGELRPSKYVAGCVDPAIVGLSPGENLSPERVLQIRETAFETAPPEAHDQTRAAPPQGTINNLAVFIRFSDEDEFTEQLSSYAEIFNADAPSANSMMNYFYDASYGALTVRTSFYPLSGGSTVASYQDPHPRAYYTPYDVTINPIGYQGSERTSREHALLKAAVDFIAPQVPPSLVIDADGDGMVDNVCFIVSYGAYGRNEIFWPHAWSLSSVAANINGKRVYRYNLNLVFASDVTTLCHEMGHTLGAPDLYHYSFDGDPAGFWDIMAGGTNPPPHMSAYTKWKYMRWISSIPQITVTGTYAIRPLTSPTGNSYRIASPYSLSEYFVVEYRKWVGTFESSVPGEGLLVYRINTTRSGNAGGPPDEVYIYRPGGTPTGSGYGDLRAANFNVAVGRTSINDSTNPSSFLTDGSIGGLNISSIGSTDTVITFAVAFARSPTLASPPNNAINQPTTVALRWNVSTGAASYRVQVATDSLFTALVLNDSTLTDTSRVVSGLANGKQYYWRVRATYPGEAYVWSSAWQFTTMLLLPELVSLVAPADNHVFTSDTIRFIWRRGQHSVDRYWCEQASDSAFIYRDLDSTVSDSTYVPHGLWNGTTYWWRVKAHNAAGWGAFGEVRKFTVSITSVDDLTRIPTEIGLSQNYPNPFNPSTTIRYGLPTRSHVTLTVFNTLGLQVATLIQGDQEAGYHEVRFDGAGLASGVYFYRLQARDFVSTKKLLLLK